MAKVKPKPVTKEPEVIEAPEKVAEEAPIKKEPEKTDSFFVYLGPNIPGVIQTASIYSGTREEVLKKLEYATDRYPRIKALLISGENLAAEQKNVTKPGTRLYAEYGRLVSELRK